MLLILNVIYVLVAIAMIALILMQRGAGAQAGSGFGAGASATVFGSRGSSNFLSKSTKWLGILFFAAALFMAWNATHKAKPKAVSEQDLGVMSQTAVPKADQKGAAVPAAPAKPVQKAVPQAIPAEPKQSLPGAREPTQEPPVSTPAKPAPTGG